MKGGKKRNTNTEPSAPPISDATAAVNGGYDAAAEEERRKYAEESERVEAAEEAFEEDEGEEEDSEADREYEQSENMRTGEAGEAERMKLADGYFEIEAVRRKRVRKGKVQYLIKWRDWSEAANTWEPVENLVECSDIIDAFEESLKAGKNRSTRKRKRKTGITHVQTKKRQPQQHQHQRTPAAGSYNVPSHVIRFVEGISFSRLNNLPCTNESAETNLNGMNIVETSNKVKENGVRTVSFMREEEKEQSELDLKLCELKGSKVMNMEDGHRLAVTSPEGQQTGGDTLANGLRKTDGADPVQSGRCTGAKKRKSGSVKRFKKDQASCSVDDAPNAVQECASVIPSDVKHPDFLGNNCKNKYEDPKSMCTITQIVKPISYKASMSNNVQEVLVAFEAERSDGTKVTVDNKFLKANNPLLIKTQLE
ncbi:hypothetical protein BUALT_Bualt19G0032900 [Buddleja alternifolia]|uniref:Chromo domain-containing protein n=1 Tax=Buddleja alternifolia TaxID=168488 RepID=A0AAV6W1G5_9LAMI|nr:hypothetical protein BUALT_Bualt19G0032900 [Buddleja alternifolia]